MRGCLYPLARTPECGRDESVVVLAAAYSPQEASRSSPLGGKPVEIEAKADWLMTVGGPSVVGAKESPRGERAQLLSAATAELLQAESR